VGLDSEWWKGFSEQRERGGCRGSGGEGKVINHITK
jgi:hypothetical protein